MEIIKERFRKKAESSNLEIKELLKENGNRKIGEVTLAQAYQGAPAIEEALHSEAVGEALDLAPGHRFLFQVDHMDLCATLFKEALRGSCRLGILTAKNLNADHHS